MRTRWFIRRPILCATVAIAAARVLAGCGGSGGSGATGPSPIPPVKDACSRFAAGSIVQNPPDLFSHNGRLAVDLSYQTRMDEDGRQLFCFMTPDGLENPTFIVNPGDDLVINVTNNTPKAAVIMPVNPPNCGATVLTEASVNMHFHGTNISPICHQDNVVRTLVNSGKVFHYSLHFPKDEPPGLYWYHPHAHMLVEAALQGGGSGTVVVEGIQDFQSAVAGLQQQIMVIRDQNVAGNPPPGGNVPSWDLTLNNIPIAYPAETPAVIQMQAGARQLWRVSNSSADSILDLQVQFDGVPQTLQIVAIDGVPTGSQDGGGQGESVDATDILIPTAGRAEFIVAAPPSTVSNASLITLAINTGPDGDNDPQRTLATIQTISVATAGAQAKVPATVGPKWSQRFAGLAGAQPSTTRTLYFSENNSQTEFFITVDGATPTLFNQNNPPAIVTTQGSVEDWTIENRSLENHIFHIHQIHFLVLSQNNFETNGSQPDQSIQGQYLDTIQIPFWDGDPTHSFPSVTVRMDFRGADVGDFVYHCHIAGHEDAGMMAIIRVMPSSVAAAIEKVRVRLVSLRWFGPPDAAQEQKLAAWCVKGRAARRREARAALFINRVSVRPLSGRSSP